MCIIGERVREKGADGEKAIINIKKNKFSELKNQDESINLNGSPSSRQNL